MDFHDVPRLPRGFRCAGRHCGLKATDLDLAVFVSDVPARAAALFTLNHFPGAPVVVGRERIRTGILQALVVNAKVSNVATGAEGVEDARLMGRIAAQELGLQEELVLMSSTGVIGRRLPMDKIRSGLQGISKELAADPWPAARGIMTTDTEPKVLSIGVGEATLTAVGKGAGMIAPNLATMLVFLFTDAELEAGTLQARLVRAASGSFQCLSVDTDTSTSDSVVLMANGLAGSVALDPFQEALDAMCRRMAEWIARDGEGATKLIRVLVEGAASDEEARRVSRSVVDSPLVKTMAFGADPNVGRVLMAVGKCFDCRIVPERVSAHIQGVEVIRGGVRAPFEDSDVRALLQRDLIEIRISLGVGDGRGLALGCDLTEGYIRENAAYASS
ncbi:MAG: bifunctional glutamate N-acetyltransferase/amino-acid acetyltransferase ArgJ [Gemmatimonadetes bacterium]|nr:bifunctional glutamate N-acetyltransferase/amino-acid acetyltransferase ArgJ [Gemmatimonadota bacterium]